MVERPVLRLYDRDVGAASTASINPPRARGAVDELLPLEGSLADKIRTNAFSCGEDDNENHKTGLFITMSRVNHSCLGNCDHLY